MNRSRPQVRSCWLGSVPYRQAWELQRSLVEQVRAGDAPDTLLLLEHPHVYTMGRKGTAEHLLWDEAERERRARTVDFGRIDRFAATDHKQIIARGPAQARANEHE